MADITKCNGTFCPLKESCFRFTAESNKYRQSYFLNTPYDHERKSCAEHYRVRPKTK